MEEILDNILSKLLVAADGYFDSLGGGLEEDVHNLVAVNVQHHWLRVRVDLHAVEGILHISSEGVTSICRFGLFVPL